MAALSGGSSIGSVAPNAVDGMTGEIVRPDGGVWNDNTQSWETTIQTRSEKTYELVQRRRGYAEFSRQYESYHSTVSTGDNPRGLPIGVHDPEVPGESVVQRSSDS